MSKQIANHFSYTILSCVALFLAACGGGGGSEDTTKPRNRPPQAAISPSSTSAYSSQTVMLDGTSSSDVDGQIAEYLWTQSSGPPVSLTDSNATVASFVVPPLEVTDDATLRLTVTDNQGATASSDLTISMSAADVQVEAQIGDDTRYITDEDSADLEILEASFQGDSLVADTVQWSSSIDGTLGSGAILSVLALSVGQHTISARMNFGALGVITKSIELPVLIRQQEPDSFQATPAAGYMKLMPVVIVNYLPTLDGINVDAETIGTSGTIEWEPGTVEDLQEWVHTIATRMKFMLEEGSRFRGYKNSAAAPYLGYQVLAIYNYYEEFSPGVEDPGMPGSHFPDFNKVLSRFPAREYVENSGVKEIWLFGYNHGLTESNMSSPTTGDISNSYRHPDDLPIFDDTYVLYQYNYTRTHAEAVHNHGHQIESILLHVDWLRSGTDELFWGSFVGFEDDMFQPGRCGWTHMPPNTAMDYDYTNESPVMSDCEDWRPDGSGATKALNVHTWGDLPYSWPDPDDVSQKTEAQWYIYWMQNMPGLGNSIPYQSTTMENWWRFTAEWDEAITSGADLIAD